MLTGLKFSAEENLCIERLGSGKMIVGEYESSVDILSAQATFNF